MFAWVQSRVPWGLRANLGSRGFNLGLSLGLFSFACVHLRALSGRRDQSDSLGFTQARLGVVWFIRVRLGSLMRSMKWTDILGFARVHSGEHSSRWDHSSSRAFTRAHLRFAWVNSRAAMGIRIH